MPEHPNQSPGKYQTYKRLVGLKDQWVNVQSLRRFALDGDREGTGRNNGTHGGHPANGFRDDDHGGVDGSDDVYSTT